MVEAGLIMLIHTVNQVPINSLPLRSTNVVIVHKIFQRVTVLVMEVGINFYSVVKQHHVHIVKDRQCKQCNITCIQGTYESTPCTKTTNRVCTNRLTCNPGTYEAKS